MTLDQLEALCNIGLAIFAAVATIAWIVCLAEHDEAPDPKDLDDWP